MHVAQLMQRAVLVLAEAGVESALVDVQLLLGHCLGKTRTELFLYPENPVSSGSEAAFNLLLARRVQREPLAYILGEQEFWSLDFKVNSHVLIPRPETEFMLEKVLASAGAWRESVTPVLDLCTGSGVIAVVLAKELGRPVVAVDISEEALQVARFNAHRHHVAINFIRSDLFANIEPLHQFGLIVSNPPYVSRGAIAHELEPEVASYEPHLALDGGAGDGLDFIRRMRDDLPKYLSLGGEVFIEFGADQGAAIADLFAEPGSDGSSFTDVHVLQDYARRDRVLYARLLSHN
ncbi:peptide chain release factor N(5)-glutamine methyltransferase [Desulfotalea psychrophila]|uniref:Release factor glutamine methyltransferase n=1 Tax=Desulfotalea psychrophila (strain LSv54 / DSM 12343) TaxID=177439 RepID=Q6AJM6_DESPS|nr:peptide chain release factor N(5)-glutamine methyltransferase [Desulfotalea psychrophila]CAG37454.1 related to HemK methylase [Desulfotalea psychrophila LSv54]